MVVLVDEATSVEVATSIAPRKGSAGFTRVA